MRRRGRPTLDPANPASKSVPLTVRVPPAVYDAATTAAAAGRQSLSRFVRQSIRRELAARIFVVQK